MKKASSTRTLEETLSQSSLLSGGSTNFSDDTLSDKLSDPSSSAPKHRPLSKSSTVVRSRNRFSAALKKFSTTKNRLNSKKHPTTELIMRSDDDEEQENNSAGEAILRERDQVQESPKPTKRKNKAANLVKKISFGSLKRVSSKKSSGTDSCDTNRPSSMSSVGQEKSTLIPSVSETSLIDLDSDENNSSNKSKSRQMQIKLTGKKLAKSNETPQHNIDLRPSSPEPNKPERRNKKLNITESSIDIAPTNIAPATPIIGVTNKKGIISSTLTSGGGILSASGGAIKKTTIPKVKTTNPPSNSDTSIFLNKTVSLERGRRFPRPTDEFRSISDLPPHPSIDNSSGNDKKSNVNESDRPSIEFEVGKQVRPIISSTSSKSSSTNNNDGNSDGGAGIVVLSSIIDSLESSLISTNLPCRDEFSSMDTTKSSESSSEPKSENSRRRITYVAIQPDISMPDELLLHEPQEPISHLSGISEYSIDSDFSMSPSSYYGDFMTDEDRANMAAASQDKREHLYKILVIGELGTGKTSFIKRYVHQFFSQNYRATIGVDFALKVLNWDQNTIIRLQLWDIAGQERFGNMTRVYYKEAVGAFIVFDVTRSATFDAVVKWKQDLDSKVQLPNGNPIPCILLANKCDQQKQGIINTPAKMDEYTKEHGFAGWFEVSAKDNINIEEAARALVNKILLNDKLISSSDLLDNDKFGLDSKTKPAKKNCSC